MDSHEIAERLRESSASTRAWFSKLSVLKKIAVVLGLSVYFVFTVLTLIYNKRIIVYIVHTSDTIRDMGFRGVLLFVVLLSVVSFPPLIGFSTINIIIGIVYGFHGWILIAVTSSVMSTVSLCLFKYPLRNLSIKIINSNSKLQLFASAIKDPSVTFYEETFILTLMKLCPLPYSLTNGGLGCVPEISPLAFFLACLICSPKYCIQIFMGIKLRKIGSDGEMKKNGMDYLILIGTGVLFAGASYFLYLRLKKRIEDSQGENGVYTRIPEDTNEALEI